MLNINKYIKALLYPAGGHQGSHKAPQAGNQNEITISKQLKNHHRTTYLLYHLIAGDVVEVM